MDNCKVIRNDFEPQPGGPNRVLELEDWAEDRFRLVLEPGRIDTAATLEIEVDIDTEAHNIEQFDLDGETAFALYQALAVAFGFTS